MFRAGSRLVDNRDTPVDGVAYGVGLALLEETPDDFARVDEWLALVDDRPEDRPCAGVIASKLARKKMASLIGASLRPMPDQRLVDVEWLTGSDFVLRK